MSFYKGTVFFLFDLIVLLWLLQELKFILGWAEHVSTVSAGNSTAATLVLLFLFIIPRDIEAFVGSKEKFPSTSLSRNQSIEQT